MNATYILLVSQTSALVIFIHDNCLSQSVSLYHLGHIFVLELAPVFQHSRISRKLFVMRDEQGHSKVAHWSPLVHIGTSVTFVLPPLLSAIVAIVR